MIKEDKVSLAGKRAELVTSLAGTLPTEERVRIQDELSIVNAKIKALNTLEAARFKAAADRRKAVGIAEAQANAARARANAGLPIDEPDDEPDDDPGQTTAIDGWIDAVLLRSDVEFTRTRAGRIALVDADPKWEGVVMTLADGIYAAARGQELPDLPTPAAKATKKTPGKPKKR
jgi:hypothetical protein